MNNAGRLAGASGDLDGFVSTAPTIWIHDTPVTLSLPGGFASGLLNDLNASGESAGIVFSAEPLTAAMWTRQGEPIIITPDGFATAINDNGEVVGNVYDPSPGADRAFFWTPETGIVHLDNGVVANDINNERVAVGSVSFTDAAVWTVTITPQGG